MAYLRVAALAAVVILIGCRVPGEGILHAVSDVSRHPAPAGLLDRCTQALDSFRPDSFIVKADIISEHRWQFTRDWHEPEFRGRGDSGKDYRPVKFRTAAASPG